VTDLAGCILLLFTPEKKRQTVTEISKGSEPGKKSE
jgi:hypothetical protein